MCVCVCVCVCVCECVRECVLERGRGELTDRQTDEVRERDIVNVCVIDSF